MESTLTLAGFVALGSLGLAAVGLALSGATRTAELRERIAALEAQVRDHLQNGTRHERKE